jgi:uncharacterized protein
MALGSLLSLLDGVAAALDDVAVLTKLATKKTAGMLGDDLALNAQSVTGVSASREVPVVWAVAKGSLLNKAVLVPTALLISAFAPWAVQPLLMCGGAFLCFEGFEKSLHGVWPPKHHGATQGKPEHAAGALTEAEKIRGAIRTDAVLSAEIIVIALGVVAAASLKVQVLTLVTLSLLMTVGVYGLVLGIVKLDDFALLLVKRKSAPVARVGHALLSVLPWLMKALSIGGTLAMFLVGGGIVMHQFHAVEARLTELGSWAGTAAQLLLGVAVGGVAFALLWALKKVTPSRG